MPERRPRPSLGSLPANAVRLVRQIEELYGPTRWKWGEWSGTPESPPAKRSSASISARRAPLSSVVLRTLLLSALALVAWYAAVGDRAAIERAVTLTLKAAGVVRETPVAAPAAEFLLALRTLRPGESIAPDSPIVRQFKDLLDEMAPKCREDRLALAAAVIKADDAVAARGVQGSALLTLVQANAVLSIQTRSSWPTSCTDTINRVAATFHN